MSTELKQNAKKKAEEFRSALRDVGRDAGDPVAGVSREPKGVLNAKLVRAVCFVIFSVGLFVTGAVCILAVWDYVSGEMARRVTATFTIAIVTLALFTVVNECLEGRVKLWPTDDDTRG